MADTNHAHAAPAPAPSTPVEGDGVSYAGIVWFIVILVGTTLVCQLLMWGLFALFDARRQAAVERATMAAPAIEPRIDGGRIVSDRQLPEPAMLVSEPTELDAFHRREDAILHGYGWMDEQAGTARIPVERAKELLLEKGFPVRQQSAATPAGK
jgi:hypothetical protein